MPLIAVALDSKAPLHPFDDEINTVAMICRVTDAHLRAYIKAPIGDQLKNIALKLGIETVVRPRRSSGRPGLSM